MRHISINLLGKHIFIKDSLCVCVQYSLHSGEERIFVIAQQSFQLNGGVEKESHKFIATNRYKYRERSSA